MEVPGIVKPGLILWLAAALMLPASPAAAQNPPVASCGLPSGGNIFASVTYTLSADCTQTDVLSTTAADIEVTINGGGHSITSSGHVLFSVGNGVLTLNDVTLNGSGLEFPQFVQAARLDATRASFINLGRGTALAADQMNLNNVYLAFNSLVAYTYGGNGTAILGRSGDVLSLHNVVVRNNFGSGGAIVLRNGSALTTTGCLTLSGNMPYNVFDPFNGWTDESTGPCSGAIGNGHAVPLPPSLMTCGFPGPGNLDVSATYQLYEDCTLTGRINISEGVEVRVVGNGRVLRSSPNRIAIFLAANSRLRLENIRLDGVRIFSWGELDARQIRAINASDAILFNMGSASFDNALFEDNVATSATSRSVLIGWNAYQDGFISIRDSVIRNNHGGLGALQNADATIELHGCVTFENNTPSDYSGAVTDNRDPDCDIIIIDPPVLVVVPGPGPHVDNWHSPKKLPPDCFHQLGAIGLLCRPEGTLEPEVQVWGVTDFSEGHFILRVAQSQADAAPGGSMVTHSPDNRVGVVVWPDRNITFSMGPNHEGKFTTPPCRAT